MLNEIMLHNSDLIKERLKLSRNLINHYESFIQLYESMIDKEKKELDEFSTTINNELIEEKISLSKKTIAHYETLMKSYKDKITKETNDLEMFRAEMSGNYVRFELTVKKLSTLIRKVLDSVTVEDQHLDFRYNGDSDTLNQYTNTKQPQEFGFWVYPRDYNKPSKPFCVDYIHNMNVFMDLYTFPNYPNRKIVSLKLMDSYISGHSKVEVILK